MKAIRGTLVTAIETKPGQIEYSKKITYVGEQRSFKGEMVDYGDNLVSPGFIDIHVHGLQGYDTMDPDPESIKKISQRLASKGVTGFLATLQTSEYTALVDALERISNVKVSGAKLLGSHLEGPFISPEKLGAQREHQRIPIRHELEKLLSASNGKLRLVTLAPEIKGALPAITYFTDNGVVVSAGHTDATYAEAKRGFATGVRLLGHCWNGMRGIHHREPGIVGAGLLDPDMFVELIADLHHVHPAVLGLTVRLKGANRVVLVSDSIKPAGLEPGEYLFDGRVYRIVDGLVKLENGVIAGSSIGLCDAVRNMVESVGVTIPNAVRMASTTPAELFGIKSGLTIGNPADITVLDPGFNVVETIADGETIYRAE